MEKKSVVVKGLKKVYVDSFKNKVEALSDVSLEFLSGKLYSVMGPSGSGKSSLLNIIGLLDKQSAGELIIDDVEVKNLSSDEMAHTRMKKIGFVFQNYYLNPKLSVYDNLVLAMKINKDILKSDYKNRALEVLKKFDIENFMNRYPTELSGGEQQRVCIARALINDPSIILADEPTGNLDASNEDIVLEHLKELARENKTVIVVTHNEKTLEYADEKIFLTKGKLDKKEESYVNG